MMAYLYTETDNNDLTYFIDFNIEIISKAMNDLENISKMKHLKEKRQLKFLRKHPV